MAELLTMTRICLRRLIGRARFFTAFALTAVCVLLCFRKLPLYLDGHRMELQVAEPFIMFFSSLETQLFLLLTFLLLAGDLPLRQNGMEYVVTRSTRRRWLLAQSCAVPLLTLLWLCWIFLCTLVVFRGYLNCSGQYSRFLKLLARNNLNSVRLSELGFEMGVYPSTNLLGTNGPWIRLGLTVLLELLLFGSVGLWCMGLNLWTKRSYGCALTVLFWVFRFSLDLEPSLYPLSRFSPLSLTDLHTAELTPERLGWILLFFLAQICPLLFLSFRQIRRTDLTKIG